MHVILQESETESVLTSQVNVDEAQSQCKLNELSQENSGKKFIE